MRKPQALGARPRTRTLRGSELAAEDTVRSRDADGRGDALSSAMPDASLRLKRSLLCFRRAETPHVSPPATGRGPRDSSRRPLGAADWILHAHRKYTLCRLPIDPFSSRPALQRAVSSVFLPLPSRLSGRPAPAKAPTRRRLTSSARAPEPCPSQPLPLWATARAATPARSKTSSKITWRIYCGSTTSRFARATAPCIPECGNSSRPMSAAAIHTSAFFV